MKTIAVILAGGLSRRMGTDKATLEFDGKSLLQRTVDKYSPLFDETYVSVNSKGRFPTFGAGELVDLRPGMGPLAGLETAFKTTDADYVFLTATDLPFSDPAHVPAMIEGCSGYDLCLLDPDEPLFAVYSRSSLPVIEGLLDEGILKLRMVVRRANVNTLDLPLGNSLMNVNDPTTLQVAKKHLEQNKRT